MIGQLVMVGQDDLLLDEMHPGHDLDYNNPARELRRCDAYTVSAVIPANTIITAWSQVLVMKGVKVQGQMRGPRGSLYAPVSGNSQVPVRSIVPVLRLDQFRNKT